MNRKDDKNQKFDIMVFTITRIEIHKALDYNYSNNCTSKKAA